MLSFLVWRLAHAGVLLAFGGKVTGVSFAFDGAYYREILSNGYVRPAGGYGQHSDVAFFPGLPWLTEVVHVVVRSASAASLLTCNALALGAFVGVWGASRAWTGNDVVARRVVIGLALFPTSYNLWMYYSEPMLLATTAGAAWAVFRGRRGWALLLLVLAATARLVGVLAGPALALARIVRMRRVDRTSVLLVASSAAGFAAVLVKQRHDVGDAFGWMRAEQAWGRSLAPPWQPLATGLKILVAALPHPAAGVGLDFTAVLLVGVMVALLWRGPRTGRWPHEPAVLATASWLLPICSVLVAGQIRYALSSWPVLLVPAEAWPRLPRVLRAATLTAAPALSVLLLWRLSTGRFTA